MPEGLNAHDASRLLFAGLRLYGRPGIQGSGLTGETVYWRYSQEGWVTVVWLTVTNYSPGLLRIRNDILANIPKRIWPFDLPLHASFELTFHCSEVCESICEPLYAFCVAGTEHGLQLGWPLFEDEPAYPRYAWTKKAKYFRAAKSRFPYSKP